MFITDKTRHEYERALAQCMLGHSHLFPGPPVFTGTFEEKELIRLQVPDGCARSWHITLNSLEPGRISTQGQLLPAPAWYTGPNPGFSKARIQWGRAGKNTEMTIDWRSGSTLQVFGSFVSVIAICDNSARPLQFAATISPGDDAAPSQPTMTLLIGSANAGGTILDTPIPRMAKTVYPHVLTAAPAINPGTAVLSFLNAPFSALSAVQFDFTDTQEPLEIPQPSALVQYDNTSLVDHIVVSLQYQLFV